MVDDGLASWSGGDGDERKLIVRGQAHLLEDLKVLEDLERVRLLFDDLESRRDVIDLLGRAERAEGVRIFIGSENKLFSLSGSSTIIAPYHDRAGRIVGVLGVIGPTRLNYARVIPMVDYTAKVVSKLLGLLSVCLHRESGTGGHDDPHRTDRRWPASRGSSPMPSKPRAGVLLLCTISGVDAFMRERARSASPKPAIRRWFGTPIRARRCHRICRRRRRGRSKLNDGVVDEMSGLRRLPARHDEAAGGGGGAASASAAAMRCCSAPATSGCSPACRIIRRCIVPNLPHQTLDAVALSARTSPARCT